MSTDMCDQQWEGREEEVCQWRAALEALQEREMRLMAEVCLDLQAASRGGGRGGGRRGEVGRAVKKVAVKTPPHSPHPVSSVY